MSRAAERFMEVVFLDVGHGQCTVVVSPRRRRVVLIDCKRGAGPQVIDFLRKRRLPYPSAFFVSHLHDDHVAGFADIFRHLIDQGVDVQHVCTNYAGHTSAKRSRHGGQAAVDQLRDLLDDRQDRLVEFVTATDPYLLDGVKFSILHPDRFDLNQHHDRDDLLNDLSGVVKVGYGQSSVLLPGDIEGWGASKLVGGRGPAMLKCSVMLFPHHGAGWQCTSEGEEPLVLHEQKIICVHDLIRAVAPKWTVLSVGTDNGGNWQSWKHPSRAVLTALSKWHARAKGDVVCTEATPHCCEISLPVAEPVPCGGNICFHLYRDGRAVLQSPEARVWHARIRSFAHPLCLSTSTKGNGT